MAGVVVLCFSSNRKATEREIVDSVTVGTETHEFSSRRNLDLLERLLVVGAAHSTMGSSGWVAPLLLVGKGETGR